MDEQHSPYAYCVNNPIIYIDPDGMEIGLTVDSPATEMWLYSEAQKNSFRYRSSESLYNVADVIDNFDLLEAKGEYVGGPVVDIRKAFSWSFRSLGDLISSETSTFRKTIAGLSILPALPWGKISSGIGNIRIPAWRVFGGGSRAAGWSYTFINPKYVPRYRFFAGLPNVNNARYILRGSVQLKNIMKFRLAQPLDGNLGGLPELIINPQNVNIYWGGGINPSF